MKRYYWILYKNVFTHPLNILNDVVTTEHPFTWRKNAIERGKKLTDGDLQTVELLDWKEITYEEYLLF